MGQQQLLLLVLGIVIVGLAVVVGIQAFSENKKKSNADALVNTGVRLANHMQAWALKHNAFGGPAAGEDLGDVTYDDIGFIHSGGSYQTLDGFFTLTPGSDGALISGVNAEHSNNVYVIVDGTEAEGITSSINPPTAPSCS